jgi:type IV pilus assembly protein PilX
MKLPREVMAVPYGRSRGEKGASLIVVLLVLLVVTVVGISGAQLALLGERSARHDRDMQIAFESAEAAVVDAENDIRNRGTSGCGSLRGSKFTTVDNMTIPLGSCLTTTGERGICAPAASPDLKPTWATADFLDESSGAPTAEYGDYTCSNFEIGGGVKPARAPRYLVEVMKDVTPGGDASAPQASATIYRITAMGFGPRVDTRAVVQVEFRKETE